MSITDLFSTFLTFLTFYNYFLYVFDVLADTDRAFNMVYFPRVCHSNTYSKSYDT